MPVLGQGLGHLHPEAVQVQVALVSLSATAGPPPRETRKPIVTTMKLAQSGSPESIERKKSLMHSQGSSVCGGRNTA